MNAIVNVDKNWGIGNKGKLLVSIPNDLKRFREITTGNVVVYGRKTLATFPAGKPLKNRTNIILTTDTAMKEPEAVIVHSLEELFEELKKYDSDDIYIIGGDSVYKQLLPYCKKVLATSVQYVYEADTYFPNLDEMENWNVISESEEHTCFNIEYTFKDYENSNPKAI